MSRLAFRWVLCHSLAGFVAVACLSTAAWAQLKKAQEDHWKDLASLCEDLGKLDDADLAKREFDRIKSLAEKFIDKLGRFADAAGGIGSKCSESTNRDLLSSVKSRLVDAINKAKDKADRLKSRADSKADCRSEIRDLRAAMGEVSDKFNDARKDHDAIAEQLERDYVKAQQRWWEMTKDGRKPLEEGWLRYQEALSQARRLREKSDETSKAYTKMLIEEGEARKKLGEIVTSGRSTPDEVKAQGEKVAGMFKDSMSIWKDVAAIRKDAEQAEEAVKKAYDVCKSAEEKYWKEVEESDTELKNEVLKRHRLMVDFANEYKK